MDLKNAGICHIDDVVKRNPSVCFIDWFSTSYKNQDNSTIEYQRW